MLEQAKRSLSFADLPCVSVFIWVSLETEAETRAGTGSFLERRPQRRELGSGHGDRQGEKQSKGTMPTLPFCALTPKFGGISAPTLAHELACMPSVQSKGFP